MTDEPVQRHQAPGGWRRGLIGVLVGSMLGAWYTRWLPRPDTRTRSRTG